MERHSLLLLLTWCLIYGATLAEEDDSDITSIKYKEGDYYEAECASPGAPSSPGAPTTTSTPAAPPVHPPRLMRFRRVTLTGCLPPTNISYRAWLSRVNVTATEALQLMALPGGTLAPFAFDGMTAVTDLYISAVSPMEPAAEFLTPLTELHVLSLTRVRAVRLPATLDRLRLRNTGAKDLPPAALDTVALELWEPDLTSLLTAPLAKCERMRELTLGDMAAERLSEGLVSACGSLEYLSLQDMHARTLQPGLLRGAARLARLEMMGGHLASLPEDLLSYSPALTEVQLMDIQLEGLPRDLFMGLEGQLTTLRLSVNKLRARDLTALRNLTSLVILDVSDNPLGDLCDEDGDSSLANLHNLQELHLARAELTRVCGDWLARLQQLRALDLTGNAVRSLSCAQLRVRRAHDAAVRLEENPLVRVNCTERDYELAGDDEISSVTVTLSLDSRLQCDCDAYWLARVLRARSVAARFEPRCAAAYRGEVAIPRDQLLQHVALGALTCPLREAQCAPGCACELAPHAGGVRALCRRPDLPVLELDRKARESGHSLVELRAPNAGVTVISAQLPLSLKLLDLENNSISRSSSDAAAELFAGGRRVRIARNPLACNCSNRPLLDVLRAHRHLVLEYDNMTCADGRPLEAVTDALMCGMEDPGYTPAALAALAAGALVTVIIVGVVASALARAETRLRLKALLSARGVRWGCSRGARARAQDAARPYDVFVSHAEADARFVAEEIVPKLEPGLRVCVSYREWPAGAWIPAQIDLSVRRARRSLCVVSPRALASRWARAELRAAHAHALHHADHKLILMLVDVSKRELRGDAEARGALEAHAHVRWGERAFWTKLRCALPAPRPHPDLASSV